MAVSIGSVHSTLTRGLDLKGVSVKFVPKLLTVEQKQLCFDIAWDMSDNANGDLNFLTAVITGDESWVYRYDQEAKIHSSQ